MIFEALGNVVTVFLNLLVQAIESLGALIALPGILAIVVGVLVFNWAQKQTLNNALASVLLIGIAGAVVFVVGTFVLSYGFAVTRSGNEQCFKDAISIEEKAACEALYGGVTTSKSSSPSGLPPQQQILPVQPTKVPVQKCLKPDAISIWFSTRQVPIPFGLPNWNGIKIRTTDFPPVNFTGSCYTCEVGLADMAAEKFRMVASGTDPVCLSQLDTYQFEATGALLRAKETFGLRFTKDQQGPVTGAGKWEDCPQCWYTLPTPTTSPSQATATAKPSASGTPVEFTASQKKVACGYWGYVRNDGIVFYIPTTNGGADLKQLTSVGYALSKCPTIPRP